MQKHTVAQFLAKAKGGLLLDVRSPAEYAQAHLPGAASLPLFSDEERKVVGTAYKQQSRQQAIKLGLDFFGPKMRRMVEEVEALVRSRQLAVDSGDEYSSEKNDIPKEGFAADTSGVEKGTTATLNDPTANGPLPTANSVFLYCWRGGMRSGAVAWLLELYGFDVHLLAGGYKAFRRYCLDALQQPFSFQVLGGYTGSGKTEVLHALRASGQPVVDLEWLAQHRGSAFGRLREDGQPTQEGFENALALSLLAAQAQQEQTGATAIWIEDESQRIGRVHIPAPLWHNLRQSPLVFLEIPFAERLQFILQQYGHLPLATLTEATQRIARKLGGLLAQTILQHLEQNELEAAFSLLLQHYDKLYNEALYKRQNLATLLHKVESAAVSPNNQRLLRHPYHIV